MYAKKRGQFTSSTLFRYRQTPCNLKRVKAHAIRRELQLQFLITFCQLAIFRWQESKSGCSSYMSFIYNLSQPIGICVFKGFNIMSVVYLLAKIRNISETSKFFCMNKWRVTTLTIFKTEIIGKKEKLEETTQAFLPILYSCFFISASTTYMSPSASTKTLRGRTSQTT